MASRRNKEGGSPGKNSGAKGGSGCNCGKKGERKEQKINKGPLPLLILFFARRREKIRSFFAAAPKGTPLHGKRSEEAGDSTKDNSA